MKVKVMFLVDKVEEAHYNSMLVAQIMVIQIKINMHRE